MKLININSGPNRSKRARIRVQLNNLKNMSGPIPL